MRTGDSIRRTMLAVQPWARHSAKEELRAVGIWPCIGHGKDTRAVVLQSEIFVCKGRTIYRLSSCAVSGREVTALWEDQ